MDQNTSYDLRNEKFISQDDETLWGAFYVHFLLDNPFHPKTCVVHKNRLKNEGIITFLYVYTLISFCESIVFTYDLSVNIHLCIHIDIYERQGLFIYAA